MVGIGQTRRRGLHFKPLARYAIAVVALAMLFTSPRAARAGWAFDTIPSQPPFEPPASVTATATYTFELPLFATGTTTPMLNRAPNSGLAGFTSSFTSITTPTGFQVNSFQPNPLIVAQSLFDPGFPGDTLTITFSQPVASLSFNFATDTNQGDGKLTLASASGNQTQNSANVGGTYPGGTFNFAPANPFSSITLSASDSINTPTPFAIDNLTLNVVVPEPAALGLIALALISLGRRQVRRGCAH